MLFSCLVDADFLDTEEFMYKNKASLRGNNTEIYILEHKLNKRLHKLSTDAPDTLVNRYRKEILQQCISASDNAPGLFSLTVPTGGGKTLSSLAFAIKHALKHGINRRGVIKE